MLAQHVDHRREGNVLAERRAARLEVRDRLVRDPLLELVDEPRLPAAGVADDRHHLRERFPRALERARQLRQLRAAPDERRHAARLGERHRRRDGRGVADLVGDDRLAFPFHLERPGELGDERVTDEALRRMADENRPGPRRSLEPRREVRRVADRGVVHLEVVADGADDHRTGVNPDPHLQLEAARGGGRVEGGEGVANRERGAHGAVRSVLVGDRGAEERHQAVAGERVDDALDGVDLAERERHVLLEEIAILLGIHALGERRRADEVAEEDRDELALLERRRRRGAELLRQLFGDLRWRRRCRRLSGREARAAIGAEAERQLYGGAALRAPRRGFGAAGDAKALAFEQFRVADDALHDETFVSSRS